MTFSQSVVTVYLMDSPAIIAAILFHTGCFREKVMMYKAIPPLLGLFMFAMLWLFFNLGYQHGAKSPCQDVEATDIFRVEPK